MDKEYIKDIEHDEIRSGFLVTTDRKKIWQKLLELFLEVDRICRKYDIPYFVSDGTMLGCARHKGFIPWDDDIDVAMFRPDYMRFIQVAAKEIKTPHFLQNVYTDNRIINWSKLMDETTSAIEDWNAFDMHQGLYVDIFPLDMVPDGNDRTVVLDEMCKEIWMSVIAPQQVRDGLHNGALTHVARKTLDHILELSLTERMNIYEDFCLKHFDDSSKVSFQMSYWCNRQKATRKTAFNDILIMDFEQIKAPIPVGYDEYLTENYGQWREIKHVHSSHEGNFVSADIPYDVMLKNINRDLLQCGDYLWR